MVVPKEIGKIFLLYLLPVVLALHSLEPHLRIWAEGRKRVRLFCLITIVLIRHLLCKFICERECAFAERHVFWGNGNGLFCQRSLLVNELLNDIVNFNNCLNRMDYIFSIWPLNMKWWILFHIVPWWKHFFTLSLWITGSSIYIGTHSFNLTCSHDRYPSNFKTTFICYYTELSFEVYNFFLSQQA